MTSNQQSIATISASEPTGTTKSNPTTAAAAATTSSSSSSSSPVDAPIFKVPNLYHIDHQTHHHNNNNIPTTIQTPSTPPHDTNKSGSQSPPQTPSFNNTTTTSTTSNTILQPQLQHHHQQQQQQQRRLSIDRSSAIMFVPKTPDHQNLSNGFDNNNNNNINNSTPLQSPTKTPRSVKRRSTDIYNLLKTPDHKIHRSNHFDDEDDNDNYSDEMTHHNNTKRSSLDLYNLLVSDDNKVKLIQQSPTKTSTTTTTTTTTTTIFNDSNHISAATSPTKNSYRVKKSDTEIKELSNNLKTRLNYAFLKVQHGWTEKPLSELEKSPIQPISPPSHTTRQRPLSLHSPKIPSFPLSTSNNSNHNHSNRLRLDEFASTRTYRKSMSSSNANVALLSALSPRQPHLISQQQQHLSSSTAILKQEIDPEKTAAMSLMELSSPVKATSSATFSSNHSSPTRIPLLDGSIIANPVVTAINESAVVDDDDDRGEGNDPEEANKTETETDVDEEDVAMTNDKTDDEISFH